MYFWNIERLWVFKLGLLEVLDNSLLPFSKIYIDNSNSFEYFTWKLIIIIIIIYT